LQFVDVNQEAKRSKKKLPAPPSLPATQAQLTLTADFP